MIKANFISTVSAIFDMGLGLIVLIANFQDYFYSLLKPTYDFQKYHQNLNQWKPKIKI